MNRAFYSHNGNGRRNGSAGSAKPVKIAIVGLGYWGPNLARSLQDSPHAEVVYLCDLEREALEVAGRRCPAAKQTTHYAHVLRDESVDAVAIATPALTHSELVAAALRAGKHVFVEKPLAASSAEAIELIDLAARHGLVLMPGHTFLYSPPVNLIRDLIMSDELGEIYSISTSRVNLGIHRTDISVAWDLGPHDFSILCYWMGEVPTYVAALGRGCIISDVPDVVFINMEFPSGTIAQVELSWLAPSKLRRTTIVGSRKMVVYDDTSNEPVRIFDSGVAPRNPETFGEYRLSYRTGPIVSPPVDPVEPLALQMLDFCFVVRDGSTPRSSAELGLDVVRIVEAIDRSLAANGAPMPVARDQILRWA